MASMAKWPYGMATAALSTRLRDAFFAAILKQDIAFHDSLTPGVLTAQCSEDVGIIVRSLQFAITKKIACAGTALGMLVICLVFSWQMTLILFVVGPLLAMSGLLAKAWWKPRNDDDSASAEARVVSEAVGSSRTVTALQVCHCLHAQSNIGA